MTDPTESADPWAWARAAGAGEASDESVDAHVSAIVVTSDGQRWLPNLLASLQDSVLRPSSVIVVDAGPSDASGQVLEAAQRAGHVDRVIQGENGATFGASVALAVAELAFTDWFWLLHDDATVDKSALARLVSAADLRHADVVGPVLLEPRRKRDRASRVSEAGQTITDDGVITGVVAEGVHDQGQLESIDVLGVNSCGMLVRREVWDALGGFDTSLPSAVQGLEFCWRARIAGHRVITQPRARIVHVEASTRGLRPGVDVDPAQDRRRWGLALMEAFRPAALNGRERAALRLRSLRRRASFLVGKDFLDARLEGRAVREWRADRSSVDRLRTRFEEAVPGPQGDTQAIAEAHERVVPLMLGRKAVRTRRIDEISGRLTDWLASFGGGGTSIGLESLTGDDFARDDQTRAKISPGLVFTWVFLIGAVLASRGALGWGPLTGPQLLPAADTLGALFSQYASPVPGTEPSAGPPWLGLTALASVLTLGHPDLAISVVLLAAVPAGFLLARRVLTRLVDDSWVALFGAAVYGLLPVLTGAVSAGQLGTVVWALCLPLLANLLLRWWDDRDPAWPVAGGVALTTTAMVAAEPLTWLVVLVALGLLGWRARGGWQRVAVAALGPGVLALSPYTAELARFPGRLLTGIEPLLAPSTAPAFWNVLLARVTPQAPQLWVSALCLGLVWLLAIGSAVTRRGPALLALGAAFGFGAIAVVLTRLVVAVPPTGEFVRPQGGAWVIAMGAALVWAASLGLDGQRGTLAQSTFDARHVVIYGSTLLAAVAVLVGTGWWLVLGHSGLERRDSVAIPAFIKKDAAHGASRTLALTFTGEASERTVNWTLLEGDFGTLGDAERGLAFGGSPDATRLAASVAKRLAVGAADEGIVTDLRRLGVGFLWITGVTTEQATAISNVPGLGTASASDAGYGWAVPGSGRLVLVSGDQRIKIEPGAQVPTGASGRVLVVAEPAGSRPMIDGVVLQPGADVDGTDAFAVPATGGTLTLASIDGLPWWTLIQGMALLGLVALAVPASRSAEDVRARAPRHARRSGGRRAR